MAGITAYSFSGIFVLKGKNILNTILTVVGVVWIFYLLYGLFFNGGYPYNQKGVLLYIKIFAFFLFVYELIKYVKKRKVANKK